MIDLQYITTLKHPLVEQKENIWQQLYDSYAGGELYKSKEYLHKFTARESSNSYDARQLRAIYFNNVQPLCDMLVGFLFTSLPTRSNIKQENLIGNISFGKSLNSFMLNIATHSCLYTTGILIDSPRFNQKEIKTEAQRKELNLNPYAVIYPPTKIRNFSFNDNEQLDWILLDNSHYENKDPFKQPKQIISYRLWTKEFYQDFEKEENVESQSREFGIDMVGEGGFNASEEIQHGLNEVPFLFVNWNDKNNSHIADTIFEDIALFDQSIYNQMSLMDEMLAGGTFKFLFYPGEVPDIIKDEGFSNLAVIPFDPEASNRPYFDGPKLEDISPFLSVIQFLITGILRKLGLNTDQEKNYVQSGTAKFFDYKKTKSLLTSGALEMERTEKELFRIAGLWANIDDSKTEIEYNKDFLGEEQEEELARMYEMLTLPYEKLKQASTKRIAEINLSNRLHTDKLDEIIEDIESEPEELEISGLVEEEENFEEIKQ